MGILELRQADTQPLTAARQQQWAKPGAELCGLGRHLVQAGTISRSDAELAQIVQRYCDAPVDRVLLAEGLIDAKDVLQAQARRAGLRLATAEELRSGAEAPDGIDARKMIRHGVAPLRGTDGLLRLAVERPEVAQDRVIGHAAGR